MHLDEEWIRLSCKTSESGITCFAELSQRDLFLEHRIESAADNVIVVQVDLVSFKLALQSVVQSNGSYLMNNHRYSKGRGRRGDTAASSNNASHQPSSALQSLEQRVVILKLAKRNNLPCLCLEGRSTIDQEAEIHHAIPVRILRRNEMQNHLPPQINHPQVQLELPRDRPIRALVDKLKGMSKHIVLEGTMKGDLTIRVDQEGASLACFYNKLIPRWQDEDGNDTAPPNVHASCILKVDAHKLSTCLQWQQSQLPMTSCFLGMVYN